MAESETAAVRSERSSFYANIVILASLFLITYRSTFVWLCERALAPDSYYSHAFLIPFISGYLIWRRREDISAYRGESSKHGLLLIFLALCVHLLGVLLDIYFTSGFSIFILTIGLSLYLLGGRVTREILFPLVFLIFMFPLPSAVLNACSIPMKLFATWCGSEILGLCGIPVVREGFQLHFLSGSLVIGKPCSGLRSLLALMALGSLFAHFYSGPLWKRGLLFSVSIPVAIISNVLRVLSLSLAANYLGAEAATGIFHDLSGFSVFLMALLLLFGIGRILR